MSEWVSLKEREPPYDEYVLVWTPGRPWSDDSRRVFASVAKLTRSSGHCWKTFGPLAFEFDEVTLWAPIELPE